MSRHNGVTYTIRAFRGTYAWVIYPPGATKFGAAKGECKTRKAAVAAAEQAIDQWVEKYPWPEPERD